MKVIWDSQNEKPLYAMNEAALHAVVQRKNRESHQRAAWCHWREILCGLVFGALMFVCGGTLALGDPAWLATLSWVRVPVSRWDAAALFVAGGIWFYYAATMYGARRRQQRREEFFASTLRGDIDRALAHTEFQIRVARSVLWWGLVPVMIATLLWIVVIFRLVGASAGVYVLAAVVMAFALASEVWCRQRAIAKRFEPRRREMDSLRAKLADPQR